MNNPHQVLGVPENATVEEIEEQYRLLSEAHRSDKYIAGEQKNEAEKDFKVITEAYDYLLAESNRKEDESSTDEDDEEALQSPVVETVLITDEAPDPAPLSQRMIAFVLDCIFIVFATLVAAQTFFPNEMTAGRETLERYNRKIHKLEEEVKKGDPSAEKSILKELENIVHEPSLQQMKEAIALSFLLVSVSYWFVGERFFAGSSFGKRMFSLATLNLRTGQTPGTGTALGRALLKTIPFIKGLFLFSYLIVFVNKRRLSGHDFLCRTMVVRHHPSSRKGEASTNASP